jgi:hypothetical protein
MTLHNFHELARVGFGLCKISPQSIDSGLEWPVLSKIIHPEPMCETLQLDLVLSEAGKQGIFESNQSYRFNDSCESSDAAFNSCRRFCD